MFLALNEIMHSKLRYALVAGVMFLIAYLVFFLTGLAYGLAQDNRTAVDKWEADSIVLSKDANSNLGMSMITKKIAEEVEGGKVAYLAQTPGVVTSKDSTEEGKSMLASSVSIKINSSCPILLKEKLLITMMRQ